MGTTDHDRFAEGNIGHLSKGRASSWRWHVCVLASVHDSSNCHEHPRETKRLNSANVHTKFTEQAV